MIEPKSNPYGDHERREMAEYLPVNARRILDVGCGGGAFGAFVKTLRPGLEVIGVEANREAAQRAAGRLDAVEVGTFPDVRPPGPFDAVYFNDVLEHMVDPGLAVDAARELSSTVVASLPNVRHIDVVRDLVLRGQWEYKDTGILDMTHLRFFTRNAAIALFESHQFDVIRVSPLNSYSRNRTLTWLLSVLRDDRFLPMQFALVAIARSVQEESTEAAVAHD